MINSLVLIVTLAACGGIHAFGQEVPGAFLICPTPQYDFGTVYSDSAVQHSFVLTNQGSRTVSIESARGTCGCEQVKWTTNEVAHGATSEIQVSFDFTGRSGKQSYSLYVSTDDPGNSLMQFKITGTVLTPIIVQPEGLNFGRVGREGRVEREVLLSATESDLFAIRSVASSSAQIAVTWEALEAGRRYCVKIASDGPRALGATVCSVRVETDHPRMQWIDIPVVICVPAEVKAQPSRLSSSPVVVEYFFVPGCKSCKKIQFNVLPELENRYSGSYTIQHRDIGIKSNYLALVTYQDLLGVKKNEPVSMVVDFQKLLAGFPDIRDQLSPSVADAIKQRLAKGTPRRVTAVAERSSVDRVRRRLASFTLAAVAVAAVVDSMNPCAIATIVFFVSLLSVARISIRRMWMAGLAFVAASFITYVALGFGLLGMLKVLLASQWISLVINAALAGVMLVFAFLSFRDAVRYHRSGQSSDILLKLPAVVQERIHRVMKNGLRNRSLVLGGLGIGMVVTVMESVCTGQVYVPTLVLMLKQGESVMRCTLYLLMYNAIFVLPMLVTLALTCGGLSTPALVNWSRRNVTVSKILLGVFFLAMAITVLTMII